MNIRQGKRGGALFPSMLCETSQAPPLRPLRTRLARPGAPCGPAPTICPPGAAAARDLPRRRAAGSACTRAVRRCGRGAPAYLPQSLALPCRRRPPPRRNVAAWGPSRDVCGHLRECVCLNWRQSPPARTRTHARARACTARALRRHVTPSTHDGRHFAANAAT